MSAYSIGVDLGGTNLRVSAYSASRGLFDLVQLPTRIRDGRDAVIEDMCDAILRLIDRYSADYSLAGIGIGTPGPLELPVGRIHAPPNLPGWDGFELREAIEKRLSRFVVLECDANAAALAECVVGQGKALGLDSLCMLTLGTGVGNGIILGGEVWHGINGMAGEAGHATVWPDGLPCGCGSRGCLEMYASATAVQRAAEEVIEKRASEGLIALGKRKPDFTTKDVFEVARSGDAGAQAIFDVVGEALGIELAALINTLNLPLYVVGGGLASAWELFSETMFREIRTRSYVYRFTEPKNLFPLEAEQGRTYVVPAKLGTNSGILGACLLPLSGKEEFATALQSAGEW
jgi:glucokinase